MHAHIHLQYPKKGVPKTERLTKKSDKIKRSDSWKNIRKRRRAFYHEQPLLKGTLLNKAER
jgi:hypothetical protein